MAVSQRLELRDASNTYTFSVDGELGIDFAQVVYKTSANPPQLARIEERWAVVGAKLCLGNSGDTASGVVLTDATTLATKLADLLDTTVADRTTTPLTHVRLVRDPGGTPIVTRTLGPSTHQGFRLEGLRVRGPRSPASMEPLAWLAALEVDLTVVAERVFADADGILDLRQELEDTYDEAGLHVQTLTTEIETAEGVSAVTKAAAFGALPIDDYGLTYEWVTNGPDGVIVRALDADERTTAGGSAAQATARVPTRARAISTIRQLGGAGGGTTAGASPSRHVLRTRTERTRLRERVTVTASAVGPGAAAWVASNDPGDAVESTEDAAPLQRAYETTWVTETILLEEQELRLTLGGGGEGFAVRTRTGNLDPVEQPGPRLPWTLRLEFRAQKVAPANDDLPLPEEILLPPDPGEPWRLVRGSSTEDPWPRRMPEQPTLWERSCSLSYVAVSEPDVTLLLFRLGASEDRRATVLGPAAEEG